jgi:hypothetical protein
VLDERHGSLAAARLTTDQQPVEARFARLKVRGAASESVNWKERFWNIESIANRCLLSSTPCNGASRPESVTGRTA